MKKPYAEILEDLPKQLQAKYPDLKICAFCEGWYDDETKEKEFIRFNIEFSSDTLDKLLKAFDINTKVEINDIRSVERLF